MILAALPRAEATLADQLHRAAISIQLDIAEGAGEFSAKEKARFCRMALRSAGECAAILDLCEPHLASTCPLSAARASLRRIVAMLTKLIAAQRRASL